jgi:hypothetical protein
MAQIKLRYKVHNSKSTYFQKLSQDKLDNFIMRLMIMTLKLNRKILMIYINMIELNNLKIWRNPKFNETISLRVNILALPLQIYPVMK